LSKDVLLTDRFRAQVKALGKSERVAIGAAINELQDTFGTPHLHRGLGVRKLVGDYFEARAGLDQRLVFKNDRDALVLLCVGDHDTVRNFLRNR
jgi:mRNA-degrading endonuclease RelE of RelBE toxin-antitoxin system